ncbi:MAG TPA: S8 family serine peptidase [Desulfotomaculum sp.]|nr:S8 family serine peptidase [Desulfotomaculum sp.]
MGKWLRRYQWPVTLLLLAALILICGAGSGIFNLVTGAGGQGTQNLANAGPPSGSAGDHRKETGAARGDPGLYMVTFKQYPGAAEWESLGRLVEKGDFTAAGALLVRCPAGQAEAVAALPYVREVKPYTTDDKLKTLVHNGFFEGIKDAARPAAQDVPGAGRMEGTFREQTAAKTGAGAVNGKTGTAAGVENGGPASGKGEQVTLNLVVFQPGDKQSLAALVGSAGGRVLRGLGEEGKVLRVQLPRAGLDALAASPLVVQVEPFTVPGFLNDRAAAIVGAAPLQAPGFVAPAGLNGDGQVVALADSGLGNGDMDNSHPDLKNEPGRKPKIIMLKSWAGRDKADDPVGHGTHMAATVAGTGAASGGKFAGLAPGASLYFEGILNKEGKIDPPADLTALFRPAYAAAARIHVNGWGAPVNAYLSGAAGTDAFVREHPDFLVIFGAGNSGPAAGTITAEANSKNALVVGASESVRPTFGPYSDNADEVASFSSRGPARDGRIRPDLVAPGTGIISALSSLVKGNFPANPRYTRLQGTSMAAAVAGGAAALLRQYFQQRGVADPPAALLKAALINGADPLNQAGAGFGRLDLTATVLGLQEKGFLYANESTPLVQGEQRVYRFMVEDTSRPFKATLAWTDPPAEAGAPRALVNDLDLVVIGPDGKEYLGNDTGQGRRDDLNNVEQVLIPHPVKGAYTVSVRAAAIRRGVGPGTQPGQDFALVYGQPLAKKIIAAADEKSGQVRFTDGSTTLFPGQGHIALGSKAPPWSVNHALPGAEVYLSDNRSLLYLVGGVWRQNAAELLPLAAGPLLQEVNPGSREGGFYLDGRATEPLWVNDKPAGMRDIPPGVRLWASINPTTQKAWRVWSWYQEKSGVIERVDGENRQVYLLGEQKPYKLAADVAYAFDDHIQNASPEDLPYGWPVSGETFQPAPGMKVRLMLSRSGDEVVYLAVQRDLAVGTVESLDKGAEELKLLGGGRYRLMPGMPVTLDGKPAALKEIRPGDHVSLLLAGEQGITLNAWRRVCYGQLVFYKETNHTILLVDDRNQMRTLEVDPSVQFFRWGRPGEPSSLLPGDWMRLTLDGEGKKVVRVDMAEVAGGGTAILAGLSANQGMVELSGGQRGRLTTRSLITKNGYPVRPEDLRPGEEVEFTILSSSEGETGVVAVLKARTREGVPAPALQAHVRLQNGALVVAGTTTGTGVYIYAREGDFVRAVPDGRGNFAAKVAGAAGDTLQLVAVDGRTGGVAGQYLTVPEEPFADIRGHWAEKEVTGLAERGLLNGYPDGNFYPEKTVSRAEFTVMLVRALGWKDGGGGSPDAGTAPKITQTGSAPPPDLPSWAAGDIRFALARGIVSGYPDGTFKPDQPVSRAEAAAIVDRVLQTAGTGDSRTYERSYRDWPAIPSWATGAVGRVTASGLMGGYPGGLFAPDEPMTRAQAAVLVWRLLALIKAAG